MMTVIWCKDLFRCRFPASTDLVTKGTYCDVVFTALVCICHAALVAFIEKFNYGFCK